MAVGLNTSALSGCHTTKTTVLIPTAQVAFATPESNTFRGISTPLKKASSRKDGNTNKRKGSKGARVESSHPNWNNPAPKPTDTAMMPNTGTSAQAFNGAWKGGATRLWPRLSRRYLKGCFDIIGLWTCRDLPRLFHVPVGLSHLLGSLNSIERKQDIAMHIIDDVIIFFKYYRYVFFKFRNCTNPINQCSLNCRLAP